MASRSDHSIWDEAAIYQATVEAGKRMDAIEAVAEFAEPSALPATVKRVDLFGHVEDTYATEGELNGWRAQQAHLVGKQGGLL